jgi:hypothetical protein
MGPIVDHTFENLAISDFMINRTRRRIADAARSLIGGVPAPGVDNPEICLGARAGDFIAPNSVGWMQAYAKELAAAQNPTGALRIAAE